MTEPMQFRTVLRGADPEQVAEAMKELQTSLVVSRRAAADRTIELSRLQEEHHTLQAELAATQQRLAELERSGGSSQPGTAGSGGGHSYGDLGARIGSMLSLAEEEATQIRAAAEQDAAERRDHAVRALAAEMATEEARLDDTKARAAALGDEMTQLRARADEEHGQLRERAVQEAEQIRQQARTDAEALHRQAEEQRAAAVAHRDEVHEHLGRVAELIGGVLGRRPERTSDGDASPDHPSTPPDAQGPVSDPTVDDVTPAELPETKDPTDEDTVPDATHPRPARPARPVRPARPAGDDSGHGESDGQHGEADGQNGRPAVGAPEPEPVGGAGRPSVGSRRSADATQVIEPVSSAGSQRRPTSARDSRRDYADAGDSFVGEPWHDEDGAPSR